MRGVIAEDDLLTIEQLATTTGMSVRNLRSHRTAGLLPPPHVRDRVGYYGPEHTERVRLVQELQSMGFNLKGSSGCSTRRRATRRSCSASSA